MLEREKWNKPRSEMRVESALWMPPTNRLEHIDETVQLEQFLSIQWALGRKNSVYKCPTLKPLCKEKKTKYFWTTGPDSKHKLQAVPLFPPKYSHLSLPFPMPDTEQDFQEQMWMEDAGCSWLYKFYIFMLCLGTGCLMAHLYLHLLFFFSCCAGHSNICLELLEK